MSQLIESLKLKDGVLFNLEYHQKRLNASLNELFPQSDAIDLAREIVIPEGFGKGTFKVRVTYGSKKIEKIEIEPYAFRPIQSLKVVHHNSIDYHLKYSERRILQELFNERGDCDDIIIIKNEYVTDSFAANLLFFDGEGWLTPKTPLLKGTKRQHLLDKGLIVEKEIREQHIGDYLKVGLVNAMTDMEEMPLVDITDIRF